MFIEDDFKKAVIDYMALKSGFMIIILMDMSPGAAGISFNPTLSLKGVRRENNNNNYNNMKVV